MSTFACFHSFLLFRPPCLLLLKTLLFFNFFILIQNPQSPLSSSKTMSSEQERREIHLEKERVPRMTSHFESLSENVNEGEGQGRDRTGPRTVGKFEMNVGENEGGGDEEKRTGPSLEEISKFREKAQQNSVDAIKAAEKRYQKVAKESAAPREESATTYAKEKAAQAKDYTFQKAAQAKDAAVSGGGKAAHYVGEKAAEAKDVSLEAGKGAAGYAGKKAAELKDKALATGWGAAHYTTGKAVEATKAAAGAIQSSAEYTDEKVVDYTGRKRAAAQQDLAAKESYGTMGEDIRSAMPRESEHKSREGISGVLEAVGETVLEIAQATKELVIGKDQTRAGEKGDGDSPNASPMHGYYKTVE